MKRLEVDTYSRFKIIDPLEFYKTVGNETNVRNRLNSNVISSLRRVVGRVTLDELLSDERSKIMERIKIEVNEENKVIIEMTLTSPNCPVAESLPKEVKDSILKIKDVKDVDLKLVWDPPWNQTMMSEAAKLELNLQ